MDRPVAWSRSRCRERRLDNDVKSLSDGIPFLNTLLFTQNSRYAAYEHLPVRKKFNMSITLCCCAQVITWPVFSSCSVAQFTAWRERCVSALSCWKTKPFKIWLMPRSNPSICSSHSCLFAAESGLSLLTSTQRALEKVMYRVRWCVAVV